jgi:hypothetical protein
MQMGEEGIANLLINLVLEFFFNTKIFHNRHLSMPVYLQMPCILKLSNGQLTTYEM